MASFCDREKLHKIVPEVLDLFVTPLVSVFVTGYLTLAIIGPVFVWAENAILGAIQWLLTLPLGIGSLIMGALYAPTVVTGIHQMYTAIDIGQIAQYGVTYWLPLASAANVAQGAAALACCSEIKGQKSKITCSSVILKCIYGNYRAGHLRCKLEILQTVHRRMYRRRMRSFICIYRTSRSKGTGVTGIFGILLCLEQPVQYLIEMIIAVGVAFVISFLIYRDAKPETAAGKAAEPADDAGTAGTGDETPETALAEEELKSPVNGKVIPLTEVADETFASEMLGTTVAVEPEEGKIVAPCDAEVLMCLIQACGMPYHTVWRRTPHPRRS